MGYDKFKVFEVRPVTIQDLKVRSEEKVVQ